MRNRSATVSGLSKWIERARRHQLGKRPVTDYLAKRALGFGRVYTPLAGPLTAERHYRANAKDLWDRALAR